MKNTLANIFTTYDNISIRNLATTLNISYHSLLKASKKPIPGEIYDPTIINYDEMENVIAKKEIDLDDYDWNEVNESFVRQASNVIKDKSHFKIGDKVYLRNHKATPYEIIYTTDTHVVILLEGSTVPQAWNWSTFMFHGPSNEPREEKVEEEA